MTVVHWGLGYGECGIRYAEASNVNLDYVTCLNCLTKFNHYGARARLAELDRAQRREISLPQTNPLESGTVTVNQSISITNSDHDVIVRKTNEALESLYRQTGKTVTVNISGGDVEKYLQNKIETIQTLLLRASDFIADIPVGALDRKNNAVAMRLRRDITDIVVGKERK